MSSSSRAPAQAPPAALAGVFLIALSIILLQIAFTRVFAIMLWHHLTYMVVSIALLGFGAAGSILTARRDSLRTDSPMASLTVLGLCYGISVMVSFALVGHMPIDSLALWHDKTNLLGLAAIYVLVTMPFLFGGAVLGQALTRFVAQVNRVYAIDLIGSAVGGALSVVLLGWFGAPATVLTAALIGVLSAACFGAHTGRTLRGWTLAAGVVTLAALVSAAGGFGKAAADAWHPPFAAGKELRRYQDDPGLVRLYSSTAEVEVSPSVPHEPLIGGDVGINSRKQYTARVVGQDGTAPTMLFENAADLDRFGFLRDAQTVSAHVARTACGGGSPDVLVIGVGGGFDVMTSLAWDASSVTAVEINTAMIEMVTERFDDYIGGLFRPGAHPWSDRVRLVNTEGRSFVRGSDERFDLIQLSGVDSFTALSTGAYTLAESYLYTTDAVRDLYSHLDEGGYVNYSRFILTRPKKPRETLRLANIARVALAELGVADPASQICVFQGLNWASTMIKRGAFTPAEIDALRRFGQENGFLGLVFDPLRRRDQRWEPDITAFAHGLGARLQFAKFVAPQLGAGADMKQLEAAVASLTRAYVAAFEGRKDDAATALAELPPAVQGARELIATMLPFGRGAAESQAQSRNDYLTLLRGTPEEQAAFVSDYDYDISPCTDDRPFFFNYYRYGQLFEQLMAPATDAGMAEIYHPDFPVGHMVLLASLVQIALLALVLIFWPLRKLARGGLSARGSLRFFGYFAALGAGFMFVEIVLMQKMVIFLGHPTYAVSVVLTGLLAFLGVGSLITGRVRTVTPAVLGRVRTAILAAILLSIVGVNHVLPALLGAPLSVRIVAVLLLMLPVGLALGTAFPLGLRVVERQSPQLLPWCWAINGFLSVFSSIFCIVLSALLGFTWVLAMAAVIYLLGFVALRPLARAA